MILPIYVYGSPVLKKVAEPVSKDYEGLQTLVADMWETMYQAEGVGLAAPQVGKLIRMFIVDATSFADDDPASKGFKRLFINPELVEFSEEESEFYEGCLSLPKLNEDVTRPVKVRIRYFDENFEQHDEWLEGMPARIAQHEYDHLDGTLFVDHLPSIRKKLMSSRLQSMAKGKYNSKYKTKLG